jgi:hypothetical protein
MIVIEVECLCFIIPVNIHRTLIRVGRERPFYWSTDERCTTPCATPPDITVKRPGWSAANVKYLPFNTRAGHGTRRNARTAKVF